MATGVSDENHRHVSALIVVLDIYPDLMKEMISNEWPSSNVVKLMTLPIGKQLVHTLMPHQQNIIRSMDKEGYIQLDLELMYKIIRHFGLVDKPSRGWGNKPKPTDVNQGDDIERMRRMRNDIVHRPRLSLTDNESQEFFAESLNIAIRMDLILGKPSNGFQNKIENAKAQTCLSSTKGKQYLESCPQYKGNRHLDNGRQVTLYVSREITDQMENNQNETTECILYVRDPAMNNSSEIVKVLEDAIHQINEGKCKIKLKAVEEGSLIIHVIVSRSLTGIDCLCKEITMLFNSIFECDYINKNCSPHIEVVLAKSDYTINEEKQTTTSPNTGVIADCEKPYSELDKSVEEKEAVITSMQIKLNLSEEKRHEIEENYKQLELIIENNVKEYETGISNLQQQLEESKSEAAALLRQNNENTAKLEKLQKNIKDKDTIIANLNKHQSSRIPLDSSKTDITIVVLLTTVAAVAGVVLHSMFR